MVCPHTSHFYYTVRTHPNLFPVQSAFWLVMILTFSSPPSCFVSPQTLSCKMTPENFTWAWGAPAEFILLGITDRWDLRLTLFLIFLPVYLVSLLGNAGMVLLIHIDAQLQEEDCSCKSIVQQTSMTKKN